MVNRHSLLNKLMSRFSYSEKFIFISMMFALSIIILSALMIQQKEREINTLEAELNGNKHLRKLRQLVEHIPNHKIDTHRLIRGDKNVTQKDLLLRETQINQFLQELQELDQQPQKATTGFESTLILPKHKRLNIVEITNNWKNLISRSSKMSTEESDKLHDDIFKQLNFHISNLSDSAQLMVDSQLATHYFMSALVSRLPELQDSLASSLALAERITANEKLTEAEQAQLFSYEHIIRMQLASVIAKITKAITHSETYMPNSNFKQHLEPLLNELSNTTEHYLDLVQNVAENDKNVPADLFTTGKSAFDASFKVWDTSINQFEILLHARKRELKTQELLGLGIAILFAVIGFLVGLYIMRQISIPLNQLTEATRRLASGDLSTRVPVFYQDEIGRVGIAFNNMAQSFQNIIGQLRELLHSIKSLADGDFSARVSVTNTNDEVGQVAYSFNNMAQSFEDIISQLHQLGINLTTSATEIAAASKQQEAIIMEQEATTREISVTANEISTTAKEFATTVSEVSKVAEHTSSLASGGKESLNHMETIMRQMVDASGYIASKLAVLNEKAGNITSVITTITKVADQTNLLSLNAAIEAEKAGEYGRSFAVIAREIRRLADQTAYATLDIEKIVNEIMSAVSSSVMGVDDFTQEIRVGVDQVSKVGEQLSKIIEQVQALTDRFESVNQGMQGQSAGAEQINEAIAQLSQTAQQTTESIHQFRNTIQQLNSAATDLRIAVSKIKK